MNYEAFAAPEQRVGEQRSTRRLVVVCYAVMFVIVVLDWATTAGVVVGLLLSIPIVLL